jgi:hypothetical protein
MKREAEQSLSQATGIRCTKQQERDEVGEKKKEKRDGWKNLGH